jgi:hypothetical protein
MKQFDPAGGIAWWLRPGGHSITAGDIDAFIQFATARPAPAVAAGSSELPRAGDGQ